MSRSVGKLSLVLCALSGLVLALPGLSWGKTVPSSNPLTPALQAELDATLAGMRERYDVPGAALAVVENGRTVYTKVLGRRALHSQAPVDSETLFMIGSVSKSMTSLMMASQVEHGRLDWNTKVTTILPSFALSDPQSTAQIRVRDLVNHASGVPRYDLPLVLESSPPTRLIASLAEIPVVAPPGQSYNYSNQMYATGGFVAALAAGARYEDGSLQAEYSGLMLARVFDPIGMQHTTLDFDQALRSPNHAMPHNWDPLAGGVSEIPASFERFTTTVAPAGAVWSNIADMSRYAITQMGGVAPSGRRVISAAALRVTQTTEIAMGPGVGYGMGWGVVDDVHGQRVLSHDGGTAGFASLIILLPDTQTGVVVLANNAEGGAIFNELAANYVLQIMLGLPHSGDDEIYQQYQAIHAEQADVVASSPPVTWRETQGYVGTYEHHLRVAFNRGAGFKLLTDFGELPLISLAPFSGPGVYASAHNLVGLVAQFSQDALTLQNSLPGDDEADAMAWTVNRMCTFPGRPTPPVWHWPSDHRPGFRHLLRWSQKR